MKEIINKLRFTRKISTFIKSFTVFYHHDNTYSINEKKYNLGDTPS